MTNEIMRPTDQGMTTTYSPPPEPTIMQMLNAAVESGKPIEYLKELITLKGLLDQQVQEAELRAAEKAYDAAMTQAKRQLPTSTTKTGLASFDTQRGGTTSYRFVTLDDILHQTVPILAENGLRHLYVITQTAEMVTVTCFVRHKDGYHEEVSMSGPYDRSGSKNAIQALGSTITYLKKYTLQALLGIAAGEDDDGSLATTAKPPHAGPDTMAGEHPNAPPQQQQKTENLSAEETTRVIEAARENAKQGEEVFRSFYVNLSKPRRAVLDDKLRIELRNLMNEADAPKQQAQTSVAAAAPLT